MTQQKKSVAKKIPKLTKANEDMFFLREEIKEGFVFNYSESYFPDCIREIAEKHDIELKYCPPRTKEYEDYGCMTMKVVSMGEEARIRKAAKKMLNEEINNLDLHVSVNTTNHYGESSLNVKVSISYKDKVILEDECSESLNISIS